MNAKADRYLALLMFVVSLWNASVFFFDINVYKYFIGLIWVPLKFTLALGPCFYFYIYHITDCGQNQRIRVWPHFIPVFIEVSLFLVQVFIGIPQGKAYFLTDLFLMVDPVINVLAMTSLIVYGVYARKRIQNYHAWVKQNYSHHHRYNLNWLQRFSTVFLTFLVVWLVYFVADYFVFDYQLKFKDYYPFHLLLALVSLWLCIESFLTPEVYFADRKVPVSGTAEKPKPNDSCEETIAEDLEMIEKGEWLKGEVEQNLLFLDPELSLKSLADNLGIHPSLASKVINDGLKLTFSDCINRYRVDAVIEKMKDAQFKNSTLLAIAFDCGFNSKTTFNRIFKKYTDQTPQQFRNALS